MEVLVVKTCTKCKVDKPFKDDPELLEFARIYLLSQSEKVTNIMEYNIYINS